MSNQNHKKPKTAEVSTNLYELNKLNMQQIEPADPMWLAQKIKEVAQRMYLDDDSKYWMLLCRERYDFTIFSIFPRLDAESGIKNLTEELVTCFNNRGYILDFTDKEDGNYEIWIRDPETKENFVYYLFNYTSGVIEV